ncbi:MAG: hypothetical protein KCHDKBKB_02025 [Elusimicrobia bacterium]|nr:hypothetical protein [Elusimicrobiota bacterium]
MRAGYQYRRIKEDNSRASGIDISGGVYPSAVAAEYAQQIKSAGGFPDFNVGNLTSVHRGIRDKILRPRTINDDCTRAVIVVIIWNKDIAARGYRAGIYNDPVGDPIQFQQTIDCKRGSIGDVDRLKRADEGCIKEFMVPGDINRGS